MKLTAEQLGQLFGYSVSSITKKFTTTAKAIEEKFNVEVIKCKNSDGEVFYQVTKKRAPSMYEEEKKNLYVPLETMTKSEMAVFVILGLAAMPQCIFRGTYKQFINYIGIKDNSKNIKMLKQVLEDLNEQIDFPVTYVEDDVKNYFVAFMNQSFRQGQIIPLKILNQCRRIVQKNNKQDVKIIQILKLWQIYRNHAEVGIGQLVTDKDIMKYTNMSRYQIADVKKLLKDQDIVRLKRIMDDESDYCIGSLPQINVSHQNDDFVIKTIQLDKENKKKIHKQNQMK